MNFASLRNICRQTVRVTHVALICLMTAYAPVASSVQIVLGTSMNVRTSDDDGLSVAGVLAKGSIVEIPDRFKKKKADGTVDADATLKYWLQQAGYSNGEINRRTAQKQDFYFPIKVVSATNAAGKRLVGKSTQFFMALRVLERSSGGLRVKEDARAYNGGHGLLPIHGVRPRAVAFPTARPSARSEARPASRRGARRAAPSDDVGTPVDFPADTAAPAAGADDRPAPADDPNTTLEAQSGTVEDCPECQRNADRTRAQADAAASALPDVYRTESRGLQGLPSSIDPRCSSFIKSDGSYGPYGQIAVRELSRFNSTFMNARGMGSVCPNFDNFDDAQKRHFWVYLLASIAGQESHCIPTIDSKDVYIKKGKHRVRFNPNGVASGLFQIEKKPNLRAARDRKYGGTFCSGDPHDPEVNTRCGVAMLEDIIDNGEGPYSMENHYWSVLINSGTKTRGWISQYEACGSSGGRHRSRR